MLLLLLLAAEPSPAPLVPMEPALPEDAPVRFRDPDVLPAKDPVPPTRGKRLLGTAVGALVGDVFTIGVWFLQTLVVGGGCGAGCVPVGAIITGVGTLIGLGPIGPLIGNRLVGGETPYWKFLLGTAAGGVLAALTVVAFDRIGFLRGPSNAPAIAAAVTVGTLEVLMGQIAVSELGVSEP